MIKLESGQRDINANYHVRFLPTPKAPKITQSF